MMRSSNKIRAIARAKKTNRRVEIVTLEKIISDLEKMAKIKEINDPTLEKFLERLKAV